MQKKQYDAIITGSGIGGLTCANLLAKQGLKVLIIEQHFKVGGYCTSYKRKKILFDVPVIMGNMRKSDPVADLFSYIGVDKKIDFVEINKLAKIIGPDMTIEWHTDTYKLEHEFISRFPHEKKAIQKYFRVIRQLWDEMEKAHYKPNFFQTLTYPLKFPGLVKYNNKTSQQMLDSFFEDEKLKEFLGKESITIGLPPNMISALYYVGCIMSYSAGGIWYPKGGFQKMSNAFADCFKEYGGDIKLKTKVKKILVESNTAKGVELENGEKIYADYVISNADTKRTFLDLIEPENLNKKLINKVQNLKQSASGFVVKLGVKMELPELSDYAWYFHFPEYGSTEKMMKLTDEDSFDFDNYSFSIDTSSLADTEILPKGINTVSLVILPVSYDYNDKWLSGDKEEYKKFKEKLADNLIKKAEKFIPGLSENIVVKDISTPLTYERYTSADKGGWYDIAVSPDQVLGNRLGPDTSIKGFYLTGAKTIVGPGLICAISSGLYTADMILKGKLTGGRCCLKGELLN